MVSNQKNHLFLEKTKKPSFGGPSPIVLKKIVFFVFLFFFGFFGLKMVKFWGFKPHALQGYKVLIL